MQQVLKKSLLKNLPKADWTAWRSSIRWPLLMAISGNVLLTLFIIGLGIYAFIATTERRSWQVRQSDNAREASTIIESFVESKENQLFLISMPDLDLLKGESQALQKFILRDPSWLEIVRLNAEGETLVGAYTDQPMLQNMFTTRQSQWFRQAREGSVYLGNVGISALDTPYLVMSVPSSDGGVVAGRLRMDVLWSVVSKIHFGDTGIAYIIDRSDGRIIAHPDSQMVLENRYASQSQIFSRIQHQPEEAWSGLFHNVQNQLVQTHAQRIPQTDWVVVTEVSNHEVTYTRGAALRISAAGLLLMWILITVTINIFMERLVLQPIKILRDGADRIGRGDFHHRVQTMRADEIGQVSEHFNQMASALAEREGLLVKARDKALVDSQFKSDLLAKVSHDLRQPLGVILGFAEMLQDEIFGPVAESQRRAIRDIILSTTHLSQMVSDLLDSARLEAHTLRLRTDDFSPDLLLRQTSSQVSLLAQRKGLKLITELDPRLPETMRGDVTRLQQIINNLAGNAIKFTQQGSVRIHLFQVNQERWAISITDTGPGIPADALEYIFEPFRQVNDPSTRDKGGVGLGLSIVHQLVQLMGGQIRVDSTVGSGSTFTVTLPLQPNFRKGS